MIYVSIVVLGLIIWILGFQFWNEKFKPHALTIRELLITILCSLFPVILAGLINSWITPTTLADAVLASFEQGQVFLYTSAFLSAFFVMYMKKEGKPPGIVLVAFIYSGLGGALLYTFAYSTKILKLKTYAPEEVIKIVEITIVVSVVVVWYWATLPGNKNSNSGAKVSQEQQESLESRFNSRKGRG